MVPICARHRHIGFAIGGKQQRGNRPRALRRAKAFHGSLSERQPSPPEAAPAEEQQARHRWSSRARLLGVVRSSAAARPPSTTLNVVFHSSRQNRPITSSGHSRFSRSSRPTTINAEPIVSPTVSACRRKKMSAGSEGGPSPEPVELNADHHIADECSRRHRSTPAILASSTNPASPAISSITATSPIIQSSRRTDSTSSTRVRRIERPPRHARGPTASAHGQGHRHE